MQIVKGNLLEAKEPFIAHVVNCMGVMGAGVAAQIKKRWPEVYFKYYNYCKTGRYERSLLGRALCEETDGNKIKIYNLFAQYYYGTSCRQLNYIALVKSIEAMLKQIEPNFYQENQTFPKIAIPYKMGCGLAGGNWSFVYAILEEFEEKYGVEFVVYKLGD